MRKYISGRYLNTPTSLMAKMFEKAGKYDDMINFSIGEPDMDTDSSIVEACKKAGLEGHTHYIEVKGDKLLREGIAKKYNEKYGCSYDINNICVTDGALHGLYLMFRAILNPGDEVLLFSPYFAAYKFQIIEAGGIPIEVPTFARDNFEIDMELLKKSVSKNTRALLLNSPNNPTGAVYSKDTIDKILDVAEENDLLVIFDDVYQTMVLDEFYSPCMRQDRKDRVVIAGSFSKAYAMTGWRVGYIIGPDELIEGVKMANTNMVYCTNTLAQRAAIYALEEGDKIEKRISNIFCSRVKLCYEELSKIDKLSCTMPKGAFYLFPDISKTGLSSLEFAELLIEKAHVLVLPGNAFGEAGEGFIRIACSLEENRMREGIQKIGLVAKSI